GLHDLLIYCETEYGTKEGNALVDRIFEVIATSAYRASIELAKEKGSFPFLIGDTDAETQELRQAFIKTGYMQKMPENIKEDVLKYGIRTSHVLTVAATGSMGTFVCVSTWLDAYFSFSYFRSGRLGKFIEIKAYMVQAYFESNPAINPNDMCEGFI